MINSAEFHYITEWLGYWLLTLLYEFILREQSEIETVNVPHAFIVPLKSNSRIVDSAACLYSIRVIKDRNGGLFHVCILLVWWKMMTVQSCLHLHSFGVVRILVVNPDPRVRPPGMVRDRDS